MNEPVHWGSRNGKDLEIWQNGRLAVTVLNKDLDHLALQALRLKVQGFVENGVEAPPAPLKALIEKAIAEESAAHAPYTTTALIALHICLAELTGDEEMLALILGLMNRPPASGGGGGGSSENLTDESTNILTDESGNNLESSGA